jgi:hypothetical protein
MSAICGTHRKDQARQKILVWNPKQERKFWRHGHKWEVTIRKDLDINIYIYIYMRLRLAFIPLTQNGFQLSTQYEHGNESPNYIQIERFLNWPKEWRLLRIIYIYIYIYVLIYSYIYKREKTNWATIKLFRNEFLLCVLDEVLLCCHSIKSMPAWIILHIPKQLEPAHITLDYVSRSLPKSAGNTSPTFIQQSAVHTGRSTAGIVGSAFNSLNYIRISKFFCDMYCLSRGLLIGCSFIQRALINKGWIVR